MLHLVLLSDNPSGLFVHIQFTHHCCNLVSQNCQQLPLVTHFLQMHIPFCSAALSPGPECEGSGPELQRAGRLTGQPPWSFCPPAFQNTEHSVCLGCSFSSSSLSSSFIPSFLSRFLLLLSYASTFTPVSGYFDTISWT